MDETLDAVKYVAEVIDAVARKYPGQMAPMPSDVYGEDDFNRLTLVLEDDIVDASRPGYMFMRDIYMVDKQHFVAVGYLVGHESFNSKDWTVYKVQAVEATRYISV